jgi:two-component system, cell cycle sensor histidine kinase PleC
MVNQLIILSSISILLILNLFTFFFKSVKKVKTLKNQIADLNFKLHSTKCQLKKNEKIFSERVIDMTNTLKQELKERHIKDVALKIALKKEEDANYLKDAFLANMSHEIRTPLNGIIGFSFLLEEELTILENKELYEYACGIHESGERLLHLLNNIIDISRIEANDFKISLKSCNISYIISKVSELYNIQATEKGVRMNIQTLETPNAIADDEILSRALKIIIDNSVKYTEKGFINIFSDFIPEQNRVFIQVNDTGIGIDSTYLPNIFEAFRQESLGYSRDYQGAGLGLALAKRLVNLMKGEIIIESVKGIGTTVSIYLPAELAVSPQESVIDINGTNVDKLYLSKDVQIFTDKDETMNHKLRPAH